MSVAEDLHFVGECAFQEAGSYHMSEAHVFLSYAAEDRDQARSVYQRLVDAGIPVWMDVAKLIPGQSWEAEIDRAIRTSRLFIACLSQRAVSKRGFVQSELKRALKVLETVPSAGVFIIPVRLDNCSLPSELEAYQRLDYFTQNGPDQLIDAVLHHLGLTGVQSGAGPLIAQCAGSEWIGGGAGAKIASGQYLPLARIFDPAKKHPGVFSGDACVVRFTVSSCVDWASVDDLFVRVLEYEAPPQYAPIFPLPYESAHVYYVEIDAPNSAGIDIFHAHYWDEKGPKNLGTVVLKRAAPEVFVLRVNARRPGVYAFSCEMKLSSAAGTQILNVTDTQRFLFDDSEGILRKAYGAARDR